jgi:invasion protein IalB
MADRQGGCCKVDAGWFARAGLSAVLMGLGLMCASFASIPPAAAQQPKPAAAAPKSASAAIPPPERPGDGVVRAQHGDWQVVCKPPPPGAKHEVCALVQSVTAEDRSNVGLTVYFQKFSNGTRVLRVFAPLGVLIPPGLGLKIDDKDVGHAPFLRCHSFACYAQVVAEDKLIEQFKTGKTAIFIIFQTEEAGIGIPISLAGFAEALAALN